MMIRNLGGTAMISSLALARDFFIAYDNRNKRKDRENERKIRWNFEQCIKSD